MRKFVFTSFYPAQFSCLGIRNLNFIWFVWESTWFGRMTRMEKMNAVITVLDSEVLNWMRRRKSVSSQTARWSTLGNWRILTSVEWLPEWGGKRLVVARRMLKISVGGEECYRRILLTRIRRWAWANFIEYGYSLSHNQMHHTGAGIGAGRFVGVSRQSFSPGEW